MSLLKNLTSVVTGCNNGIGYSILKKFAENKSHIFACVRKIDKNFLSDVSKIEKNNKIWIKIIKLELDSESSIKEAFEEIKKYNKKIDVLVNNAGILDVSLFQMTKKSDLEKILKVNFINTFEFTKYMLKLIKKKENSSIINIGSISAHESNIGRFSYATSKMALITGSKNLSQELSSQQIRVNSISPGIINTSMLTKFTSEEQIHKRILNCALKRIGQPEEIANVALFLASSLSSYVNGIDLIVDGGKIN